jgi:hypothetical protein
LGKGLLIQARHALMLDTTKRRAHDCCMSGGTGMARSIVSERVDALIRLGLVVETGIGPSTGGSHGPYAIRCERTRGAIA